jgi:protein-disulfide isomerase
MEALGAMKRIGYVCTSLLLAVAVSGLVGCQQQGSSGVEAKLDDINQRLERIEGMVKQGAGAQRPMPQRPPGPDPAKVYAVPIEGAPAKGPANAKITVVKAFEFACPFCERARPTMDEIVKTYGDDVRIVYKHYIVHPATATIPSQAVCAAHKQNKFAEMENLIWEKGFKANRNLSQENMETLATELKLDLNRFKADMQGECAKLVQKDHQELAQVGVTGTPGFFINGRFIRGAQPFPAFKAVIDEELKKANERIEKGAAADKYYQEWVLGKGEKKI